MLKNKNKTLQMAGRKLVALDNPKSLIAEQYRNIRTNIHFSAVDRELKTILITSCSPGEGKSTTAANIAAVFAQEGKRVLLVDSDMRKPTIHYTFNLPNRVGLSSVLTRQETLDECLHFTDIENLQVLTCGPLPPNPAELIGSKAMTTLIEELKQSFDLVLFDAPPLLAVTDSKLLANECEGTILVLGTGSTEKEKALKAVEMLKGAGANVLGVVMNRYKLEKDHYYQYYGTGE